MKMANSVNSQSKSTGKIPLKLRLYGATSFGYYYYMSEAEAAAVVVVGLLVVPTVSKFY